MIKMVTLKTFFFKSLLSIKLKKNQLLHFKLDVSVFSFPREFSNEGRYIEINETYFIQIKRKALLLKSVYSLNTLNKISTVL